MKQIGFSALAHDNKKKKTRRDRFLQEMDKVVPWQLLLQEIEPFYPKSGNRGRPPIPLTCMLRIYCLQQWYALSDPAMEDMLYDMEAMRRFTGIDYEREPIPDETTICKFRHLLEKHQLTERLFLVIEQHLGEKGLLMKEGTIVDATIIAAPPSTKNKDRKRDPEMAQSKKGNQWHFGLKAHVGTDAKRGLVHSVVISKASVHDSQHFDDLVHGKEKAVYGDKAYASAERKKAYEAKGINWRVNRKAARGKSLGFTGKIWNRHQNRTRAKVEHVFRVLKCQFGYQKTRYRGLAKNAAQLFSLFGLINIYMVRKDLGAA